jgi:Putative multicopper oxidases
MKISDVFLLVHKRKRRISITSIEKEYSNPYNHTASKLNPLFIKKYKNQLVIPPVFKPTVMKVHDRDQYNEECHDETIYHNRSHIEHHYHIDISEFKEQVLPKEYPKTTVWGYGGLVKDQKTGKVHYVRSSPGPTFEAMQGIPVKVKWINRLEGTHPFPVDPTLHWANPNHMPMDPSKPWPPFPPGFHKAQRPIPTVTHLHGGEVSSLSDGHPEAWFTYDGQHGPEYNSPITTYPNKQEPTTLWYHDHSLGITRLNVYAGLAGFYLLREGKTDPLPCYYKDLKLPEGKYEIPLVIQDRMFCTDGSFLYDNVGINPNIHPYWVPELFGDTIMVNGKVWPNLEVERRQYRFRLLNGSNARFYNFKFSNGLEFIQIGSDGGFLPKPVKLTSLLLAPAERADILVDFSEVLPGSRIILQNDARAPYPEGEIPDHDTVGQIMQFTVPKCTPLPVTPPELPRYLNCMPHMRPDKRRILTLYEVPGPNGPEAVLLNGLKWMYPVTENPIVGSTEEWSIVNLTMDTHPIHLHLIQFRLLDRQDMDVESYQIDWEKQNGVPPLHHNPNEIPIDPYLIGKPIAPDENELGWKDTIRMNPGQVTRILIRFAPQNNSQFWVRPGDNLFPFDPTIGPGYVWHCHILDHEDNEMMRPYKVLKK